MPCTQSWTKLVSEQVGCDCTREDCCKDPEATIFCVSVCVAEGSEGAAAVVLTGKSGSKFFSNGLKFEALSSEPGRLLTTFHKRERADPRQTSVAVSVGVICLSVYVCVSDGPPDVLPSTHGRRHQRTRRELHSTPSLSLSLCVCVCVCVCVGRCVCICLSVYVVVSVVGWCSLRGVPCWPSAATGGS